MAIDYGLRTSSWLVAKYCQSKSTERPVNVNTDLTRFNVGKDYNIIIVYYMLTNFICKITAQFPGWMLTISIA